MLQIPDTKEMREVRRQYRMLMTSCRYISNPQERKLIRRAFENVLLTFRDNRRETGDLFLSHAISVARIVSDEMERLAVG